MRSITYDRKGVSNILGYVFSFGVASMLMISAVLITTGILDNRTAAVAGMQAQSVANKIADAVVEAIAVLQSPSNMGYKKTLDIPMDIAGRSYYVDVTDKLIYVNTTDGLVSRSCPTYTAEDLKIGVGGGRTYCGGVGKINVSVDKSDTLYKLDFGSGNTTRHSPVASGYYFVSNTSAIKPELRDPPWWNNSYTNRVPILINNTSPYDLVNVPVKVVLNTSNFDYSKANVVFEESSSNFTSNLVFNDPSDNAVTKIEILTKEWNPGWFYTYYYPTENTVTVRIKEIAGGYDISYIRGETIKLNGNVKRKSWDASTGIAKFDGKEALESLENGEHFLKKSRYTVTVSGLLKNGVEFYGLGDISINAVYVRPGDSIKNAIQRSSPGGTVFVYKGTYVEEGLSINKPLNLIGESRDETIFNVNKSYKTAINIDSTSYVNIDSFWVYPKLQSNEPGSGPGIGIDVSKCEHVNITNCRINKTAKGIRIGDLSSDVSISNCLTYDITPSDDVRGNGIAVANSKYVRITNCTTYHLNTTLGDGFDIRSSEYVDVIRCISHSHYGKRANGVKLIASNHCNVIDSRFYNLTGNATAGVEICADVNGNPSKYNVVKGCVIYGNNASGDPNDVGRGVYIADAGTDYNIIENCTIYKNSIGIQFTTIIAYEFEKLSLILEGLLDFFKEGPKSHNSILNCSIYENLNHGIAFFHMLGNNISNCNIYNNGINPNMGTSFDDPCGILLVASGKNNITNCNIYKNGLSDKSGGCGLILIFAGWNHIEYCNIYGNIKSSSHLKSGDGIKLMSSYGTFSLTGCGFNEIKYCNVFDNGRDGLELYKGNTLNKISNCNFYCNGEKGVYISGINPSNQIEYSNFEKNFVNARDESITTLWNGNFWDDFESNCGHDDGYYCIQPGNCSWLWCRGYRDNSPRSTRNPNPGFFQVNQSYTEDFYHTQSIKNALQNMDTMGVGGTIKVYAGTYNGIVTIKQANVKLIGEGNVIVSGTDPPLKSTAITVKNYSVSIEGLTIKDSLRGIWYKNNLSSGGLPLKIKNCKIENNTQEGIYLGGNSNNYCIINSCNISNNKYGIYGGTNGNKIIDCTIKNNNDAGVKIKNRNSNNFTNCTLSNNKIGFIIESGSDNIIINSRILNHENEGIKISGSSNNNILNCNVNGNNEGISITGSSTNNKISNCTINYNAKGIYIDSLGNASYNEISYSNISGSTNGVEIKDSFDNTITYCNIYNNSNGVYIHDDGITIPGGPGPGPGYKPENIITNCSIYNNNNYGVLTNTSSYYNKIYHNIFKNKKNANAKEKKYPNIWDNGYPSGGNLWSDYDDESDNAFDYFSGESYPPGGQEDPGSDGIADKPYNKNGVKDKYPFCRKNPRIPYYIDYWNPHGESVILVNISIGAHSAKCINLYYGYDGALEKIHNHTMNEISLFFDDFLGTSIDTNKWLRLQASEPITPKYKVQDGCINFSDEGNITTKDFAIPDIGDPPKNTLSLTTNESMYIVEAKMKINRGQGNMILLKIGTNRSYYLVSANATPSHTLSLHKDPLSQTPEQTFYELDNAPSSNLSHWIRMKAYIHLSKTYYPDPYNPSKYLQTNATFIKTYVYDYNTFADLASVSALDTWSYPGSWSEPPYEAAQGKPYPYPGHNGKIGLGSGILSSEVSNVLIDWIRVMKTPVVQPTVTVGSMESINYGWDTSGVKTWNTNNPNPFELTNPVLCDFNYGISSLTGPSLGINFVIKNLPAGKYTITVTKGNYTNTTDQITVTVTETGSESKEMNIPDTDYGKFETKWVTINKEKDNSDINIVFSGKKWLVNSIIIDRGAKGVKVGWE
ncbi:MAG: DUF7266 family protein [Thermoplasmatota archaeon]